VSECCCDEKYCCSGAGSRFFIAEEEGLSCGTAELRFGGVGQSSGTAEFRCSLQGGQGDLCGREISF
jgi:hypothetical protein